MAAKMVKCAKLGRELPAIDPSTPEGDQALKMVLVIAGPEMMKRVQENISAQAYEMWKDHALMVMNEFRLDPTSEQANQILAQYMEQFFFGEQSAIPNYVPPDQKKNT